KHKASKQDNTPRDALNIGGIDNSALVNYIAKCIAAQYTFIVKYELAAYGIETSNATEYDEEEQI
ncbi:hypothetical protein ACLBPW_30810, partial [Klebsiella pneumoniae]|uniref:hypothetical protein n=1 Tax=Klebsiella pneumoniae TaxID=573 RepID=UPI00396965D7